MSPEGALSVPCREAPSLFMTPVGRSIGSWSPSFGLSQRPGSRRSAEAERQATSAVQYNREGSGAHTHAHSLILMHSHADTRTLPPPLSGDSLTNTHTLIHTNTREPNSQQKSDTYLLLQGSGSCQEGWDCYLGQPMRGGSSPSLVTEQDGGQSQRQTLGRWHFRA